uniref:Uncharacterized protein n=1 Tax=Helianthus annuus TaxID=4232 RepID=A0A251SR77_HELAN
MDLLKPEITDGISVKTTTDWETEFSQRGFSVLTIFKHSGITCILNSRYILHKSGLRNLQVEIQGFVANKDS